MKRLLLVVLAITVVVLVVPAQSHPGSQMKTYVSPSGDFQFRYPDWLIDCKAHPENDSCESYIPVCGGDVAELVVCLAYPKHRIPEDAKRTFDGAAFIMAIVPGAKDEASCYKWQGEKLVHTSTVNGIRYWTAEGGGAALGHWDDEIVHRNFHNGACYEVDIRTTGINPMVYPDPPRAFDKKTVEKPLRQALNTFEFLK